MTQVEAIADRVVVEKVETVNRQTAGGLFIPDDAVDKAKEKSRFGRVLSIGEQVKGIKVNDIVIFGQFAGVPVKDLGEDVHIVKYSDIHGKYIGNV